MFQRVFAGFNEFQSVSESFWEILMSFGKILDVFGEF